MKRLAVILCVLAGCAATHPDGVDVTRTEPAPRVRDVAPVESGRRPKAPGQVVAVLQSLLGGPITGRGATDGQTFLWDGTQHRWEPGTISTDIQALLDGIGSTRGAILYRGASGWAILAPGTAGHALTSGGAGADPSYAAITEADTLGTVVARGNTFAASLLPTTDNARDLGSSAASMRTGYFDTSIITIQVTSAADLLVIPATGSGSTGGALSLYGGTSDTQGGPTHIYGGQGTGGCPGGNLDLNGGSSASGTGGQVYVLGGIDTGNGTAGGAHLWGGTSASGTDGSAFMGGNATDQWELEPDGDLRSVAGTGYLAAARLESTVSTGTAPLVVASTTVVSNLNADLLDGHDASYFAVAGGAASTPWITLLPQDFITPASNPAEFSVRNNHSLLAFDQTTAESAIFETAIPDSYASGSDLIIYGYVTSTATTGDYVFSASIEYIDDGTLDIDADSFDAAVQAAAVTTSGTAGVATKFTITLSNAAADDVVAGAPIRITIARVPGDAGDTMAADAQLLRVTLEQ